MAKPSLFAKIRSRATATGVAAKYASLKLGADLSNFVQGPASLAKRLGVKKVFVEAGKRPSIRSILITPRMLSKAKLEREEGRELKPAEVTQVRGGKRYLADYFKDKLRHDPTLDDASVHPNFKEEWLSGHRRFVKLAEERTGMRLVLTKSGEWIKTPIPGAERKVMSAEDWAFYMKHYHANEGLYQGVGPELLELPPGAISPPTVRRAGPGRSSPGRANRTGRSVGSYGSRRRAA